MQQVSPNGSKKGVRILGTGCYLPKLCFSAEDLDRKMGREQGTARAKSGVERRFFVDGESPAVMGAAAARQAAAAAEMTARHRVR